MKRKDLKADPRNTATFRCQKVKKLFTKQIAVKEDPQIQEEKNIQEWIQLEIGKK